LAGHISFKISVKINSKFTFMVVCYGLVVMFAFEWNLHLNIITHKGIAAILHVVGLSLDLAVSYCCTNVLCCPYSV